MKSKLPFRLIIVFFFAQINIAGSSVQRELGQPIALERASDSIIYVLSADRNIRTFNVSGERLTLKGQFSITGSPIDFTYSRSGPIESIFVCSINIGKGVISRYSMDGKLMRSWWLWHPCGGVDYDPGQQVLYFGTTDTREIYRIDVRADTGPESLSQLPKMEKMGPVVLDRGGKSLYVGDIAGGFLFEFDIVSRSSRSLISGLGSVSALYTDPNSGSLYIVDSVARKVFVAEPNSQKTPQKRGSANIPTRIITHAPELRSPSGIVPLDNGRFLVSDYGANALFIISAHGTLISRFP